jgi:pimeloyl-ACP methyl ester carboxylesterase
MRAAAVGAGALIRTTNFVPRSRRLLLICTIAIAIFGYYTIRVTRIAFLQYNLYHPTREQIDRPAGKFDSKLHDIANEIGDGTRVAGWSLPPDNGAVIIFIHGAAGNRKELLPVAMALNEHGYGALLLDMPGHGESGGGADWGISSQLAVERAIDFALKGDNVRHIAIFGFSMGCIAVQVSTREPRVKALVLLSAYVNLVDYLHNKFRSRVPLLDDFGVLATRAAGVDVSGMRTLDVLKSGAPRPVFMIAGTADASIPV